MAKCRIRQKETTDCSRHKRQIHRRHATQNARSPMISGLNVAVEVAGHLAFSKSALNGNASHRIHERRHGTTLEQFESYN